MVFLIIYFIIIFAAVIVIFIKIIRNFKYILQIQEVILFLGLCLFLVSFLFFKSESEPESLLLNVSFVSGLFLAKEFILLFFFRQNHKLNASNNFVSNKGINLVIIALASIFLVLIISFNLFPKNDSIKYLIYFLLIVPIIIDSRFINIMNAFIKAELKEKDIILKTEFFRLISTIKTIALLKDTVISDTKYYIKDINLRKSISKESATKILQKMVRVWKNAHYKIIYINHEGGQEFNDFEIIYNSFNSITINYQENLYLLESILKESENQLRNYTHQIKKNDTIIAKFLISDNTLQKELDEMKILNELGLNTALVSHESPASSKTIELKEKFDKIYYGLDNDEIIELILKLQEKAPTLFVTNSNYKSSTAINVFIGKDIEEQKNYEVRTNSISGISQLIILSALVHRYIKNIQLFTIFLSLSAALLILSLRIDFLIVFGISFLLTIIIQIVLFKKFKLQDS